MRLGKQNFGMYVHTCGLLYYHDGEENMRCTGDFELQWTSYEGKFE